MDRSKFTTDFWSDPMRHLLALALLFGSAAAYAAPVPKELIAEGKRNRAEAERLEAIRFEDEKTRERKIAAIFELLEAAKQRK